MYWCGVSLSSASSHLNMVRQCGFRWQESWCLHCCGMGLRAIMNTYRW